jgi:hypothetical protein
MDLHRKSVDLLTQELKQIGFGSALTYSVVEKELYPHYVGHLIGIGECGLPMSLFRMLVEWFCCSDLHETSHLDRDEKYFFNRLFARNDI